ncbi:MAG: hypothetical protein IJW00_07250 [Clostridia bacterium]|nr:hypothetical protein [Clostridia bacterium]
MLFKWLGAGLILLVGGYASLAMGRMERRRLDVLDGYIALLRYIKGQINCYAMPVEDIISAADPSLLSACLGERRHNREVDSSIALTLPDMVRSARLYMEPETERLLCNFISELGQTFRTEQVMRCEDYIQALGAERQKLSETAPARTRISSVLSLCTALGLVILLW